MTTIIGAIFEEVKQEDTREINFDDFRGPVDNDWSIPEAYMCVLLKAVYADGVAKREEIEYVRGLVSRCKTFRNYSNDDLAALNLAVKKRMDETRDPVGEACHALPSDMHLCLFAHAVDIVLSDRDLDDAERRYLDELMDKMSITEQQAKEAMRVMFAKNRY